MSDYKIKKSFLPYPHYMNFNFSEIKNDLKTIFESYKDYDTVFVIKNKNNMISINKNGRIDFYGSENINSEVLEIIKGKFVNDKTNVRYNI